MSPSLTMLRAEEAGPVPEVVELLREALRRAEAGEVIGVALAMTCTPRAEMSAIAVGAGGIASLAMAIIRMQQRLLQVGDEP